MAASGSEEEGEQKIGEEEKQDVDDPLLERGSTAVAEAKVVDEAGGEIERSERKFEESKGEHHTGGATSEPAGDKEADDAGAEAGDKERPEAQSATTNGDHKEDNTAASGAAGRYGDVDNAEGFAQLDTAAATVAATTDGNPDEEDGLAVSAREETSFVEPDAAPTSDGESKMDGLGQEEVAADVDPADEPSQDENLEQPQTTSSEGKREGGAATNSSSAGGGGVQRPQAPEWPAYCNPAYRMPAELDVGVLIDGEVKSILVKIERSDTQKVFQGGYWHKGTGKVYHHASTQFGQRERPVPKTEHLRTRDTQTCRIKSRTMQTTNECGTQMARTDMHFNNDRDTFKTAGEYQTAVQYWRVRERKTVTIQRFWRGFSARSRVWSRREERWAHKEKELEASAEEETKKRNQRQREMQRRMDPSTVQDFEVLYNDLDHWRDAETRRIKQSEVGERRQLALGELLHKETRLLQTIDRLKITAAHEGKERRTRRMLELMSAPKQWQMGDGEVAEITTPWTKRARELQELHEALEAPLPSVEERLDVLLHLKWTVGEFDCRLTRDIAELVDREADLLSRGRGEASLRPLRQRIRNLFLRFAETPDFNPEATRFVRVPPKYKKLTDKGVAGLTSVSC